MPDSNSPSRLERRNRRRNRHRPAQRAEDGPEHSNENQSRLLRLCHDHGLPLHPDRSPAGSTSRQDQIRPPVKRDASTPIMEKQSSRNVRPVGPSVRLHVWLKTVTKGVATEGDVGVSAAIGGGLTRSNPRGRASAAYGRRLDAIRSPSKLIGAPAWSTEPSPSRRSLEEETLIVAPMIPSSPRECFCTLIFAKVKGTAPQKSLFSLSRFLPPCDTKLKSR